MLPRREYRPFSLTGHFLNDKEALVFTSFARPKGTFGGPGLLGGHAFRALGRAEPSSSTAGFVPQGRELAKDRGESPSDGPTEFVGLMRPSETRGTFTPADRQDENTFYARNVADLAAAKEISQPVAPFTIDLVAAETPPGGLPQAGETRMSFTNNHLQYAITWYGLAAALLAVFAVYVRGRLRERDKKPA